MKRIFVVLIGSLLASAAHASSVSDSLSTSFKIANPKVAVSDANQMYTLTLAESRGGFSFSGAPLATVSLACGPQNQSGTSLFAVSLNGEVKLIGRKRDCRGSLEQIERTPARFAMSIKLTPNPDVHASPGSEYTIEAVGQ